MAALSWRSSSCERKGWHRGSLFDSSSSTATETNQQVGAEGNTAPVFGAITTKGNKASSTSTATSGGRGSAASRNRRIGSTAGSGTSTSSEAAGTTPASGGGGGASAAPALSGSGNVQLNLTSSDTQADTNLTTIAEGSIVAQNELANNSIAAQNALAGATLQVANNALADSFGFAVTAQQAASNATTQSLQAAGQAYAGAEQTSQNFGAVEAGGNPNLIAQPIDTGSGLTTSQWLLIAGVVASLIAATAYIAKKK